MDGSAGASGGIACASGTLTLSGSTAQANAMSAWTKAYQTACPGATINYGGGGSGAGVTQFTAGTVDFAGSDFPLSSEQKPAADARCGSGNQAVDLPMVAGPVAAAPRNGPSRMPQALASKRRAISMRPGPGGPSSTRAGTPTPPPAASS